MKIACIRDIGLLRKSLLSYERWMSLNTPMHRSGRPNNFAAPHIFAGAPAAAAAAQMPLRNPRLFTLSPEYLALILQVPFFDGTNQL